jgi:hypothetical protein
MVIVSHSTVGIEARVLGKKVVVSSVKDTLLNSLQELGLIFLSPVELKENFIEIQKKQSKYLKFETNFTVKFGEFLKKRGFF